MRETKFRLWDKEKSMWYKDSDCLIELDGSITQIVVVDEYDGEEKYDFKSRKDLVIMQYTSLKDKNGKEIYEGDVVKITGEQEFDVGYSCEMKDSAIVKWDEKECQYFLDVIRKRTVNFSSFESTSIDTFSLREWAEEEWWIEYEVVGNIYENPELLK